MFFKYNFPALLWTAVILYLTLLPAATMPEVPEWEFISFHTAAHAGVFFVLAVLLLWGLKKQNQFLNLQQQAGFYTFFFCFLLGILIEWLQSSLGWGRQGDAMDIISDTIGTILGMVCFYRIYRRSVLKNYF